MNTKRYITMLAFLISSTAFLGNAFARNFAKRFDEALNGKILSGSNVLITCDSANTLCSGAQNFVIPADPNAPFVYENGAFNMVNVDVDGDASTFNSSSTDISFPASSTVVFAGLYWSGQFTDFGRPHKFFLPPAPADKNKVKFKVPNGNYVTIAADTLDVEAGFYQGFADVTSMVTSPGQFSVADAQFTTGKQMFGGWTLIVVVKAQSEPFRRVVVWDGFLRHGVGNLNIGLSDSLGTRRAESSIAMNLVTYDGDKGKPDYLFIDGNILRPVDSYGNLDPAPAADIANSTIRNMGVRQEDRNPSFKNTLGYDADVFELRALANSDADLDLVFQTNGDIKHIGLITVQSDVEGRFIQTDWQAGPSTGTSTLMDSETGFLNRTGHIFHDTAVGDVRSVQFSYEYAGDLYEITPVRSNTIDINYINFWLNNASYPVWECNKSQFWLYRQVNNSRVSWMHGLNGRFNCSGTLTASYSIIGALAFFGSVIGQASPTGINASWGNQGRRGHLARFTAREFRIDGTMDSRSGNPNPEHSVTIDDNGTEIPYNWGAPAPWALASNFDGRLESKVFDALVPRGFGDLTFDFAQTNGSVARVFFRTGDNEADVLAKSWEGPFDNGQTLGSGVTNNKQFFQYAIETTLTDPTANSVESELVIQELAFDLLAITSPFRRSSAGTWKRVSQETEFNVFDSQRLLETALSKKLIPPSADNNIEADDFDIELKEFDPGLITETGPSDSVSCSSTGKTATPWFAFLLGGFLIRRVKKKK